MKIGDKVKWYCNQSKKVYEGVIVDMFDGICELKLNLPAVKDSPTRYALQTDVEIINSFTNDL